VLFPLLEHLAIELLFELQTFLFAFAFILLASQLSEDICSGSADTTGTIQVRKSLSKNKFLFFIFPSLHFGLFSCFFHHPTTP
jgi:hypothetical protein